MSGTVLRGGDFLATMAASSARRATAARARESEAALRTRADATPPAPALRLDPSGFDLIAEFKRRAPSMQPDRAGATEMAGPRAAAARARLYAAGGAAAISVLTEPESFDGDLADLAAVARAVGVPAMRKDFLVDPYQVFEARAAGAGGVLLILRVLDDARLVAMLDTAAACGLFVLLEAFDALDLARATTVLAPGRGPAGAARPLVLVGVNTRDLATLEVDGTRLGALRSHLPPGRPAVAESGIATPEEVADAARLGYRLALVGGALMRAADPATRTRDLLRAARTAGSTRGAIR